MVRINGSNYLMRTTATPAEATRRNAPIVWRSASVLVDRLRRQGFYRWRAQMM